MDTPYDLIDQSLDLLAQDPATARKLAVTPLRQWQNIAREVGLGPLAYDLEQLESAIEKADAAGIKRCLTQVSRQTRDAAAKDADGVLRSKLEELAGSLEQLADAFEVEA